MAFYYLSFCDVTKPEGTQFLGATIVQADAPEDVLRTINALGANPGGEIAMMRLDIEDVSELPPEAQIYINRFVPREEVMAGGGQTTEEAGIEPTASVCQEHNTPARLL